MVHAVLSIVSCDFFFLLSYFKSCDACTVLSALSFMFIVPILVNFPTFGLEGERGIWKIRQFDCIFVLDWMDE